MFGCVAACLFSVALPLPAAFDPKAGVDENAPALGVEVLLNANDGLANALTAVFDGCAAGLVPKENVGAVIEPAFSPGTAVAGPLEAGAEGNTNADFDGSADLVSVDPGAAVAPSFDVLPNKEPGAGAAGFPKLNMDFGGGPAGVVLTVPPKPNAGFGGGPAGVVVAALLPNTELGIGVPAGVVLIGDAVLLFAGV